LTRKLLAILLALPFFFSCKTGSEANKDNGDYTIHGIHDIDISKPQDYIVPIVVKPREGVLQQPVTISVESLPPGVTADIHPATGTPGFTATMTINNDFTSIGGKYPIKIVGTSGAGRREYELDITIPTLDGWLLGDSLSKVRDWLVWDRIVYSTDTNGAFIKCNSSNIITQDLSISFTLGKKNQLPKVEGQQIVVKTARDNYNVQQDEVLVLTRFKGTEYRSITPGQKVVITYSNGKYNIKGSKISMNDGYYLRDLYFNLKQ
jgi:hypothetical protein